MTPLSHRDGEDSPAPDGTDLDPTTSESSTGTGRDPCRDLRGTIMKRTTQRIAALAAVATIALAGCAGQDSGDSGSSADPTQSDLGGSEDAQEEAPSATAGSDQDSAEGSASSGRDSSSDTKSGSSMKDPAGTHIARTAALTISVEDVEQASAKVRSAASSAGGYISSEETRLTDDDEPTPRSSSSDSGDHETPARSGSWAEIVVTVPVDELDSTMTTLSDVGTVTQRTSDAEDLTKQYTDTKARVRTMKKSVERLRSLISDTEDLEQIVTLEDELSQREADLESMVSQQKSLEKRTTTAPITVSLVSPAAAEEQDEEADETGFVAGLDQGWAGFTSALTVALTLLGAVTPFALTALVLLAPLVWWLRRRTHRVVPADAS